MSEQATTQTTLNSVAPPAAPAAAPAAAASAAPAKQDIPLYAGDESWKNSLPDELKNDPTVKITKSVADLAKGYVHASKMIGADKIVKPGPKTTDEEWGKIFDALGRPESPDKYDLKIPEGSQINEDFHKGFKETLHKAGVLPSQGQKMLDWYQGQVAAAQKAQTEAQSKAQEEAIGGLKKEWGQSYDTKIQGAQTGLKMVLDEAQAEAIMNDPVLGNHPQFIRLAAKLGEMVSEDKNAGDRNDGIPRALSPTDAKKEINSIFMDSTHPYNDKNHPNHKAELEAMQKRFMMMGN